MESEDILRAIGKVLANQGNEKEIDLVKEWQQSDKQNKADLEYLKAVWDNTRMHGEKDTNAVFQHVINRINTEISYGKRVNYPQRTFGKYYYGAAAVIFLAVSLFAVYKLNMPSALNIPPVEIVHKTNLAGQKSKVYLPDGSIVWLNAESELQFPQKFDSTSRTVNLSGEAFFEVAKDLKRPFTVETGALKTTAIGTSFNIRAYHDLEYFTVALKVGKVKVASNENNSVYLNPGNCIKYHVTDHYLEVSELDVAVITAWKDGVILFKDADLPTIVQELERWYGVTIQVINTPRQDITFTGKFENESLRNVLESMSYGRSFTYFIDDKNVTIKFQ